MPELDPSTSRMDDPSQYPEEESDAPEGDIKDGYCIEFYVHGDGSYSVGEPHPISPDETPEEGDTIPDLTQALKRLLNMVKQNPIGEDAQSQFDAGYQATTKEQTPL